MYFFFLQPPFFLMLGAYLKEKKNTSSFYIE